MRIPLIEFDQLIDESVVKRGRTYFNKGLVVQCEEVKDGTCEAVVSGTEDYTVRLNLTDGIISDCLCDCPYDMGSVCKHIVAVCFHLRQGSLGPKNTKNKSDKSRKAVKRKTVADRVNELHEKITHDELKRFISEATLRDRSFREMFLSSFAARDVGESKAFYVKRLKAILRAASDRHGFIGWHSSGRVWADVSRLLDSAQKHIEEQNYMSAIYICTAVMEQMTEALQYADDCNGSIGDCIRFAFDLLFDTAGLPLPEGARNYLIDYCFTAFDKKVYEGWDWHTGMLQLASMLLESEEELQCLLARAKEAVRSEYEVEEAETTTYQALLKIRGEKEAQAYLEQHISNPSLRSKAIETDLKKKRYEHARSVAQDGVEYDQGKRPGLVQEWYDWLLKIAQAQNNREDIIDHARMLFIDGFRLEQDYYGLMKQHVAPSKWKDFVEQLIGDVATKSRGYPAGRIAEIYVREGWYDRLLQMLKTSPSLDALDRYERYLKKEHASELAVLYAEAVIKYVSQSTGRPHYKNAVRYLRRIKKLGFPDRAAKIVETLRAEYSKRRALLEELDSL